MLAYRFYTLSKPVSPDSMCPRKRAAKVPQFLCQTMDFADFFREKVLLGTFSEKNGFFGGLSVRISLVGCFLHSVSLVR